MTNNRVAVVAVGGNALISDAQHEDVNSQVKAVEKTCKHIADMIVQGWNVIVTHGNGPQVGFIFVGMNSPPAKFTQRPWILSALTPKVPSAT